MIVQSRVTLVLGLACREIRDALIRACKGQVQPNVLSTTATVPQLVKTRVSTRNTQTWTGQLALRSLHRQDMDVHTILFTIKRGY